MSVIATNTPQVSFVDFDEQSRVFKFEYGTQLIEYTFLLQSDVSAPVFHADLIASINDNTFPDFLKKSFDNLILIPTGENGVLSGPLLLAMKVPVQQ